MLKFFRKKDKQKLPVEETPAEIKAAVEERLKTLADGFINDHTIEIVTDQLKQRVSPIKWLYPGYSEYSDHAIIPRQTEKNATEIIHEAKFVNKFLQDKRDIDGQFAFFVARVEGNYVLMSDSGNKIFDLVRDSEIDDYDTLVLLKQAKRLFPKFNSETFGIDLKHIEVFGDVFNKLKAKLSLMQDKLSSEQKLLISIDIPTYTQTSIQIENSIDSFYIYKLSQVLERISKDINSVTLSQAESVILYGVKTVEKVKDSLCGNENSKRYYRAIENLEKIFEHLTEIHSTIRTLSAL